MTEIPITEIAFLIYDDFTALDLVGPYEVLNKIPNVSINIVGTEKREYKDNFGLTINSTATINEIYKADVLIVPGGNGSNKVMEDRHLLNWIKCIDSHTIYTASICSGAIILAEAGLLDEKECTTHWRKKQHLSRYRVKISDKRYIQSGKYITSAGVSAGIDMALYLAAKLAGDLTAQAIQLSLEYDPVPPFNTGTPEKAPVELTELLLKQR